MLAIFLKYALTFTDTPTIVWVRMFVAAALLFSFFKYARGKSFRNIFRFNKSALLAGVFLSINYFGYMKGIELTSASNAQVMIQLAPTILIFIGIFFFKEIPSKRQWLGIAIAAAGFYLFYQNQLSNSFAQRDNYLTGNIWILIAAISWALFSSLQKLAGKTDLHLFNFFVYLTSSFVLLPGAQLTPLPSLSIGQLLILAFLGINTLIAYGFLGEAFKRAPASQVSLIIIINPLITIGLFQLMSELDMDIVAPENITWSGLFGALLVVAGVGTAVLKPSLRAKE